MSILAKLFSKSSRAKRGPDSENISANDFPIVSSAKQLALFTVLAADRITSRNDTKYLNKSKATITDTAIFSCYITRALCIMSTHDRRKAELFSDTYISTFLQLSQESFSLKASYRDQFDNRVAFYDRIFMKKSANERFPAIVEEFEYIIKTDIINRKFAQFSESSPLPILGFFEDMACQAEVASYFKFLLSTSEEYIKDAQAELK